MPISIPGTFQPDGGPYGTGLISGADWLAPFVWVTSGFGAAEPWRVNPPPAGFGFGTHGGDDLAWSGCYGQPIRAWQTCSVTSAGWEPVGGWILGVDLGIGDDDVHERVAFYHTLEPIHAVGDMMRMPASTSCTTLSRLIQDSLKGVWFIRRLTRRPRRAGG